MNHIDLTPYFADDKDYKTGRPRCDAQKLLKVILFAFMEHGISSLRDIEKLCRNDIRFMYFLESIHGALLCMNRSIQSEATFGIINRNHSYKRLIRRGNKNVILELTLISCDYNLYKCHNKKMRTAMITGLAGIPYLPSTGFDNSARE